MLSEIEARFNGTVTDGVLDRKKLGQIVFSDAAALNDLTKLLTSMLPKKSIKFSMRSGLPAKACGH
jgi:dephospho-CoA kinase